MNNNKRKTITLFLLILLILSILVRIDYNSWQKVVIFGDTGTYMANVNALLQYDVLINPQRTPSYPLFLIGIFILFGLNNLVAVAIVQSLLGIMTVFIAFLIVIRLTDSIVTSFIAAILLTFNYNIIAFDTAIVTEATSAFLITVIVFVFYQTSKHAFSIVWCISLNVLLSILIFLRPIFIMCLLLIPCIAVISFIRTKKSAAFTRLITAFVIFVLVPVIAWMFAMKKHHGFFGLSNVAHINSLRVVMEDNLYKAASPKYKEITDILDTKLSSLGKKEKVHNAEMVDLLTSVIPMSGEGDLSYLMKYSLDVIQNKPLGYLISCIRRAMDSFSAMDKMDVYEDTNTFMASIGFKVYKNFIYRPFRKGIATFLFISFTIFIPIRYNKRDNYLWLTVVFVCIFIWFHWFMLAGLTYSDFDRLRMPIDVILIIFMCIGFLEIINLIKDHLFRKEKSAFITTE